MSFDENQLTELMRLCYIDCTEEEKHTFAGMLARVLSYVDQLQSVDTEGVEPCYRVMDMPCMLREDEPRNVLTRAEFLAGAPAHTGGMVRVPPVMKEL